MADVLGGGNFGVHDGPGGRALVKGAGAGVSVRRGVELYDVVVIGGYSYSVPGVDEGYGVGVETVNGYFGEQNHVLSSGVTRGAIEAGSWTWGRGSSHTRFAIAVVRHDHPRDWTETFAPVWWNYTIPDNEVFARAVAWADGSRGITLRLQFGRLET